MGGFIFRLGVCLSGWLIRLGLGIREYVLRHGVIKDGKIKI